MWDARRCWSSPISARALAKVGSTPALQLPLPGMDSNQEVLMIYTCLRPPDLQWRHWSSSSQCLSKRAQIPMQNFRMLLHTSNWACVLPPPAGHNPKRRNPALGWSWAPERVLEADFPEQQGTSDTLPSANHAEQQDQSCFTHGIRQTRTPSQHGAPVGRELDTNVHDHNIRFLFGRQQKTLQRLAGGKDVIVECEVNAVLLLMDQQGSCSEVFLPLFCLSWNHSWEINVLTGP